MRGFAPTPRRHNDLSAARGGYGNKRKPHVPWTGPEPCDGGQTVTTPNVLVVYLITLMRLHGKTVSCSPSVERSGDTTRWHSMIGIVK